MIFFDQAMLSQYESDDIIHKLIKETTTADDVEYASHRWMLDSLPKRLIYWSMYGDLLIGQKSKRTLLDVGGGYTSLTRLLAGNYRYTLLDIMAHDSHLALKKIERQLGQCFWMNEDWHQFQITRPFDVVLANDIFPNVDQRLDEFIGKFLPLCRELRVSLTYYNSPRWYKVKRTDGDEIFFMLAWDGELLRRCLSKYVDRIEKPDLDGFLDNPPSLFPNGRQIALVCLRGDQL